MQNKKAIKSTVVDPEIMGKYELETLLDDLRCTNYGAQIKIHHDISWGECIGSYIARVDDKGMKVLFRRGNCYVWGYYEGI